LYRILVHAFVCILAEYALARGGRLDGIFELTRLGSLSGHGDLEAAVNHDHLYQSLSHTQRRSDLFPEGRKGEGRR
jgi:hypothetical protein